MREAVIFAVLLALPAGAAAQNGNGAGPPATVPFGVGETMEYRVTVGRFGTVGEGSINVVGLEDVAGRSTYHLRFDMEGGVAFAKVDDRIESWLDTRTLQSWRFRENKREVGHERYRLYDFKPELGVWQRENREMGPLASDRPLDDVSFLYYIRTLPLEVGDVYTIDRYFKESGNPVVLEVLRKDTVKVDAGEFPVIVVRPIIRSSGLFGEGQAEIAFSDDDRRMIVQFKSRMPIVGSLDLHLKSYTPGEKLRD